MPKLTDRDRLADLEARHRKMADEVEKTRRALRGKYAAQVLDIPVERLTERVTRMEVRCEPSTLGGAAGP